MARLARSNYWHARGAAALFSRRAEQSVTRFVPQLHDPRRHGLGALLGNGQLVHFGLGIFAELHRDDGVLHEEAVGV